MHPPAKFDVLGVAKFILLQTVAVLALVFPTTYAISAIFYDYLKIAQATDPHAISWFIALLACAETVAFCPIMVIPISMMMRRIEDAQGKLAALADTDALTGLLNRRGFEKAVERLTAAAVRRGGTVAALVFDVDHFKAVNDRFGHETGDKTLRALSALLAAQFAGDRTAVGRWGGEEFAVFLEVANPRAAEAAGERMRAAFAACEGPNGRCTISVGVAAAPAGRGLADLMRGADAALYEAKSAGRNRVVAARGAA